MKNVKGWGAVGPLCAIASIVTAATVAPLAASGQPAAPATTVLTVSGPAAGAGIHSLRAGFAPSPFTLAVRPVGSIPVAGLHLGAGCRGFTNAQPDVILRFTGAATFLRVFARSTQDLTLIIADPSGRFSCNDDVTPGRDRSPMVDLYSPRPGQYDIWIGTHVAGEIAEGNLFVTQEHSLRP